MSPFYDNFFMKEDNKKVNDNEEDMKERDMEEEYEKVEDQR